MGTEKFPKARFAMGAGDLQQVTTVTLNRNKGVKNEATLRKPNAGQSWGGKDDSVEFESILGEEGFERDFDGPYQRNETVNGRLKVPGGTTYSISGLLDALVITSQVDGAVTFKAKIVGDCGEPT